MTTPKQKHTVTNLAPGSAGELEVIAATTLGADWTPQTQDVNGVPFPYARGILCGTAGVAMVDSAGGAAVNQAIPLQQGYNPVAISKMYESGTTAQNMVALY